MSRRGARDQVDRLLALVPYLRARDAVSRGGGGPGVPGTAGHDPPRHQRADVLRAAGLGMGDLIEVDFEALEGEDVIRLSNADYLTRPLRLDSTEAAALVVGLRALLEGSAEEEREVVQRALRKIEEAAGEAAGIAAHVDLRPTVDADDRPWVAASKRRSPRDARCG